MSEEWAIAIGVSVFTLVYLGAIVGMCVQMGRDSAESLRCHREWMREHERRMERYRIDKLIRSGAMPAPAVREPLHRTSEYR